MLTSLEIERYKQAFHENDIDGELLRRLTDNDLKDIGVSSLGHRRNLLEAIEGRFGVALSVTRRA